MGKPRPAEVREKISKSQRERHRKLRESAPPVTRKRCSHCGKWKDAPKEFGWTKRKLSDGEIVYHVRSQCKECTAERSKAYREKLAREGKLAQKQAEWNENRKKRRYRKPSQTLQGEYKDSLPTEPFARWLKRQLEDTGYPTGCSEGLRRRIDAVVAQEYAETALATIDALLIAYGKPELLDELYPLPDQG